MIDARFPYLRPYAGAFLVALAPLPLAMAACSANDGSAHVASPGGAKEVRSEVLKHEPCDEAGNRVEALDISGDGKPDVRRVFDKRSGHEICSVALSRTSKPDLYEYFDGSGTIRRREFCFDDTGLVNAVEYYEGGKLVRREYDTGSQHRIDTWDWFDPSAPIDAKSGRPLHPTRRERDTMGTGHVNQWWTWDGDKVTIAVDNNGDGKPDPESALVLVGPEDGGPPMTVASATSTSTTTAPPPASDAGAPTAPMPSPEAGLVTTTASDGGAR